MKKRFKNGIRKALMLCVIMIPAATAVILFVKNDTFSLTAPQKSIHSSKASRAPQTYEIEITDKKKSSDIVLVNKDSPISADYSPKLTELEDGSLADEKCAPYLKQMLDDCKSAGLYPIICSSYRTREEQEALFEDQVNIYINEFSITEATALAAETVASPDTSEHRLGLAFDIVDADNQLLNESQKYTPVQSWLMENCADYGFILRYPQDKSHITGVIFEPWHYRFVGAETAKEITESGICLEEYLDDAE